MLTEKKSDTKGSYWMTVFIWNSRKDKTVVTESKSVVASARGGGGGLAAFHSVKYILHYDCGGSLIL